MWQVGVVFAALASFSGAVGDALVRLSFVVEEKRVRKARRQVKHAQQRKRERELKRSSFVSSVASTVQEGHDGGEESAQSRFSGGHGSSECDAGRQQRQLSCPSKSSIGSGGSTPECMQPVDRYEKDDRSSISGRRQKGRRRGGSREREQDGDIKIRKRPLYLRPLWVLGTCFGTAINSLLSIISLDFASAAVVTPFAGLHIFWNVILSRFVLQERVLTQHYVGSAFILLGLLLVLCFGVHTPPPLSLDQLLQLYSQNSCVLYFSMSILAISFCIYVSIAGRDLPDTSSGVSRKVKQSAVSSRKHHEMQLLASRTTSPHTRGGPRGSELFNETFNQGKLSMCTSTHASVSEYTYPSSLQCTTCIPSSCRSPSFSPATFSASSSSSSFSQQQMAPCSTTSSSSSPPPFPATPYGGREQDSTTIGTRETTVEGGSCHDEVQKGNNDGAVSWRQHSYGLSNGHKRDPMAWTGEDWGEDTNLEPHIKFLHSRGSGGAREEAADLGPSFLLDSREVVAMSGFDEKLSSQVDATELVTLGPGKEGISAGLSRAGEADETTASFRGQEEEFDRGDDAAALGGRKTEVDDSWGMRPDKEEDEAKERASSLLFFPVAVRRFCTAAVSGMCGGNTNILMEHVMKVWHEESFDTLCNLKFFSLLVALAAMAAGQLLFLNIGLSRYEALYVVPTTMSTLIVSSCLAEIGLFIQVLHLPRTEFLLFGTGCFAIVAGIMLLSGADLERKEVDGSSPNEKGMEETELSDREETVRSVTDQMNSSFSQRYSGVHRSPPRDDFDDETSDDFASSSSLFSDEDDQDDIDTSWKRKKQPSKEKELFFSGVLRNATTPKVAMKKLQEFCTLKTTSTAHEKITLRGNGGDVCCCRRLSSSEERFSPSQLSPETCDRPNCPSGKAGGAACARAIVVPFSLPTTLSRHSPSEKRAQQNEDDEGPAKQVMRNSRHEMRSTQEGEREGCQSRPPIPSPSPPPPVFSTFSPPCAPDSSGSSSVLGSLFSSRRLLKLPWGSKLLRSTGVGPRTGGGVGRTRDRETGYEHLTRAPSFHDEDREDVDEVLRRKGERQVENNNGHTTTEPSVIGRRLSEASDSSTAYGSTSAISSFPPSSSSVVSASTQRSSSEYRRGDRGKFLRGGGRGARHLHYRMIAPQHCDPEALEEVRRQREDEGEVVGRSLSKRGSFSDVEPSSPPSTPYLLERSLSAVAVVKLKQEGRWEDAFAHPEGGEVGGRFVSSYRKSDEKAFDGSTSHLESTPPLMALHDVLVVDETPHRHTGEGERRPDMGTGQ